MKNGNEVEINFINKRSLLLHLSVGPLYLRACIGKKLTGHGAGSSYRYNARLISKGFFNGFNIVLHFSIAFKIDDQDLVLLKSKIMTVQVFQLAVDNDCSGNQCNGQSKLKNNQRFTKGNAFAGRVEFSFQYRDGFESRKNDAGYIPASIPTTTANTSMYIHITGVKNWE